MSDNNEKQGAAVLTPERIEAIFHQLDGRAIIQGENQMNWNAAVRKAFARAVEHEVLTIRAAAPEQSARIEELEALLAQRTAEYEEAHADRLRYAEQVKAPGEAGAQATGVVGELPLLPAIPGHPEPRVMRWTSLETKAIKEYGEACTRAALARTAAAALTHQAAAPEVTRLADGYESGFFASSPRGDDGQFTLHYKTAAQAEAAYMLVTSIIDATMAAPKKGAAE